MVSLAAWYGFAGSISTHSVSRPSVEAFYWVSIMLFQTLGTALGDWTADRTGLGYDGGAGFAASAVLAGFIVGGLLVFRRPASRAAD